MKLESDGRALLVREDVTGAPVRVGQCVHLGRAGDDASFDERFLDRVGVVTGFFYDDVPAQFPRQPLVVVDGLGEELFFPEELRPEARVAASRRGRPDT
ncbi:MAG: Carotenogenesis protein CarS [Myxococcota bacterium]